MTKTNAARRVRHCKVGLALHTLREGGGPQLLLLHGLGERSPATPPDELASWPGAIHALDFTGHGDSDASVGGGYTAELLMADTDAALAALGPCTIHGRGLGAYVALLAAGGRPTSVRGAILCDGPGLAGGGSTPSSPLMLNPEPGTPGPPDPFALIELARDLRPPDYATAFVRQAVHGADASGAPEDPIAVVARQRPEWLVHVLNEPGVKACSLEEALTDFAAAGGD